MLTSLRSLISPICPPPPAWQFCPFKKEFPRRLVGKYLTASYIDIYSSCIGCLQKSQWKLKTLQMLLLFAWFFYLFLFFKKEFSHTIKYFADCFHQTLVSLVFSLIHPNSSLGNWAALSSTSLSTTSCRDYLIICISFLVLLLYRHEQSICKLSTP